jgi:hypothetical protein
LSFFGMSNLLFLFPLRSLLSTLRSHRSVVPREPTIVPYLIHEVADFKEWEKGYYDESGGDRLIGHSKAHQFRFYVNPQGVPLMQYKVYCTDPSWVPEGGIALWNVDPITKKTMFPTG